MIRLCECRNRLCVCDDPTYRTDAVLECGNCEIGEHWTAAQEKRYLKRVERNEQLFGKPIGYLKLIK